MTTPPDDGEKLIDALEEIKRVLKSRRGEYMSGDPQLYDVANEAISTAKALHAELAELRKKAEALDWLIFDYSTSGERCLIYEWAACPAILKQMIAQKEQP